jgi:hypothetical protein
MNLKYEIDGLRRRFVGRIRSYAIANELTPTGFAKLAAMPERLTRGMHNDGWQPTIKTIERLNAVIPIDFAMPNMSRELLPPTALDLKERSLQIGRTKRLQDALAAWKAESGVANEVFWRALSNSHADLFCTTIRQDYDNEFRLLAQGEMIRMWGEDFNVEGKRVADQPDQEYNAFVVKRLFRALSLGEPLLQAVRAECNIASGRRTLAYWSLLLPLSTARKEAPDTIVSVCLPDIERRGETYPGMS